MPNMRSAPGHPARGSLRLPDGYDPAQGRAQWPLPATPRPQEFRYTPAHPFRADAPAPRKVIPDENFGPSLGSDDDDWDFNSSSSSSSEEDDEERTPRLQWKEVRERSFRKAEPAAELARELSDHLTLPTASEAESSLIAAKVILSVREELAQAPAMAAIDSRIRYFINRGLTMAYRHPPTYVEVLTAMQREIAHLQQVAEARLDPKLAQLRLARRNSFSGVCDPHALFKKAAFPGQVDRHADAFYDLLPEATALPGAAGKYQPGGGIGFDYDEALLRDMRRMHASVERLLAAEPRAVMPQSARFPRFWFCTK